MGTKGLAGRRGLVEVERAPVNEVVLTRPVVGMKAGQIVFMVDVLEKTGVNRGEY